MSAGGSVLFRNVCIDTAHIDTAHIDSAHITGAPTDVLVVDGSVQQLGQGLRTGPRTDVETVDGDGATLLPGLHDHHIHLAASAAAMESVQLGPPTVTTIEHFAAALAAADALSAVGVWIRGVGYHESTAGSLDRDLLDRVGPDRPVRIQDRSGIRWTLNSPALEITGADRDPHPGIERDATGRATGRIDRADDWLRRRIGSEFPDLSAVGRRLAALGVTGVTDCTPYRESGGLDALASAARRGELPQRVHCTGGIELVEHALPPPLQQGPVKVVLDEGRLPDLDGLVEWLRVAHGAGRPVAVHAVTAATLAFALAAWVEAGTRHGDRIEHGSVISPSAAERIAGLGLSVITQPGFVAERGDRYLLDVDADDVAHLYPCASLLAAGVAVAAGSDAPYSDMDPWRAVRAAVDRRTRAGATVGAHERVPLGVALGLYLGDPLDPGGTRRRIAVGAPGDLVLLGRKVERRTDVPTADDVRATYRDGLRL